MHYPGHGSGVSMRVRRASLIIASLLVLESFGFAQQPVSDDPNEPPLKPNYDAFAQAPARLSVGASAAPVAGGARNERQERLGVPTFVWGPQSGSAPRPGSITAQIGESTKNGQSPEEAAARRFLGENASQYSLSSSEASSVTLAGIHNTGRGAIIVKFKQSLGGVEIFREEIKVVMNRSLELVATSGYLVGSAAVSGNNRTTFTQQPEQALASAVSDLFSTPVSTVAFQKTGQAGPYDEHNVAPNASVAFQLDGPARVKKILFRLPDHLEAAYYVEVNAGLSSADMRNYSYVFSAGDGRLLFRLNLTAQDSYSYRVWSDPTTKFPLSGPYGAAANPQPTGLADGTQLPFVPPSLVNLQNFPFSMNDPWLPPNATRTVGNNVEAYADLIAPDGFTPNSTDTYAFTTSAGTFDRSYDVTQDPSSASQIQAAITQLFYNINFFHDWYYDSGFKEADGNAQLSNFGRGGLGNDSIKAEAYDYSGRNNANMATPSDGARPRMQMYLFDGGRAKATLTSPTAIAGDYLVGTAAFGPQTFTTTGQFVLVNDGVGAASDGCETPFVNAAALAGKIAVIDRGVCSFLVKVKNAQVNGAAGVLIVNNTAGVINLAGTDATIVIGTLTVTQADGAAIKAQLAAGVTGSLNRPAVTDRNGALDNQIIAHEWGHYISHRLILDSNGLGSSISNGLGEGWADFHALLMTVKASDALSAANANFSGVYALGPYATPAFSLNNNNFYFGIRRYPYSTNTSKDPLTFHHISDAVTLPSPAVAAVNAVVANNGATNSEVHNTGEIWATMLWECYAALLRDTLGLSPRLTFDQAQGRMKDYLVASYKLTPADPTLLEARNALIAVAYASDPVDGQKFWQAFAKRGAGVAAVAPDRYDVTNISGLAESFAATAAVETTGVTLLDNILSCNTDGFLDNGDTGTLNLALKYSGAISLNSPTATVTSNNPNVHFPNGNTVKLSALAGPFSVASLGIRVSLSGASGIQQLDFNVSIADPALTTPITTAVTVPGNVRLDTSSTTEDPQTPVSNYRAALAVGSQPWQYTQNSLNPSHYRWHGPDEGIIADSSLVTPPLAVGDGPLTITFGHRYSFEFSGSTFFDGGVIEISTNSGGTWTDIGKGYDHSLAIGGGNRLEGRPAYSGISAKWPALQSQTLSLGTAYSGQTVLVRFRIAADVNGASHGWDLENITFTGVTNSPFRTLVVDTGCVSANLTISKTHAGDFMLGQTGASYTIKVNNTGSGPTSGTVRVVDNLPSSLTATSMGGTGWSCTLENLTCTRSDALNPNTGYQPITLEVNVAPNAPSSVVNFASVSGGGPSGTNTTSDPTKIGGLPDLQVTKSHSGDFTPGQTGAIYTIQVSNSGTAPTSGVVQVADVLPFGLIPAAIGGTGWTCTANLTCSRSDALSPNAAYAPITVVVNVATNAPPSVTNTAIVSGGGETNTSNDTAIDPTNIGAPPDLQVIVTHDGDFARGEQGLYIIKVINWGSGSTRGAVQLSDNLPAGLTATGIVGDGWTCTLSPLACTRTDALASNRAYPPIGLAVDVALNAPSSVVNIVTVSGGGDSNLSNNTASDPTNIR